MRIRSFTPNPLLEPFVQLVYCVTVEPSDDIGPPQRIVPDGVVEFLFHAASPFAMRFAGDALALQPRSFLVSQTRRYIEIVPVGQGEFLAVRFRPWTFHNFSPAPVYALADCLVAASDLWGRGATRLEDRLATEDVVPRRVGLIEEFLLEQLGRHYDPRGDGLASLLWQRRGRTRVARFCREAGVGERQLERLVRGATGMTPKHLGRLSRFLHACAAVRERRSATLTEVGFACGYYDQAHFIADFRELSGMTPGELAGAERVVYNNL